MISRTSLLYTRFRLGNLGYKLFSTVLTHFLSLRPPLYSFRFISNPVFCTSSFVVSVYPFGFSLLLSSRSFSLPLPSLFFLHLSLFPPRRSSHSLFSARISSQAFTPIPSFLRLPHLVLPLFSSPQHSFPLLPMSLPLSTPPCFFPCLSFSQHSY